MEVRKEDEPENGACKGFERKGHWGDVHGVNVRKGARKEREERMLGRGN